MAPKDGHGFWHEAGLLAILVVGESFLAWFPSNQSPRLPEKPCCAGEGGGSTQIQGLSAAPSHFSDFRL